MGKKLAGLGRFASTRGRHLALLAAGLSIAACGGGGGNGGSSPPPPPPPPINMAPTANAGGNQTVQELTVVNLTGSATDPDGDNLSFSWMQTGGTSVTLNTPDVAMASFTAPDVMAGAPQTLTFELTVTDPGGLSSTDVADVVVQEPAAMVTLSGTLQYEFPPPGNNCNGLAFNAIELRPIRQATVQLLDATGTTLLATDTSDDAGRYAVTVDASTRVILRVRAEVFRSGNASWDVQVRNNVDVSASPPPLEQRPLYVLDSAVFDSGVTDQTRDLTATTGWGTSSYTGPRAAAPFAILDTIYSAMRFVQATDANASFPPLDAFWSPDNKSASPTDIDAGELPTSFYDGQEHLFLLGTDGVDTEEFDDHVIAHEWGHYFEDNFSRSDSIGGAHSVTSGDADTLDKRVAFGEGWATAFSGMALANPLYCDTSGTANAFGFSINIENRNAGTDGWFNEVTILKLIYDLWDTNADIPADSASLGFGPIYNVFTGPQATTAAFTSIFSFATHLKQQNPGQVAFIDALLGASGIDANGLDEFGSMETNAGGATDDVFPLYTDITLGASTNVCVNSQFDSARTGNKLSEHRYLRLNIPTSRQVTFDMTANPAPSQPTAGFDCTADVNDAQNHEHSDPDFFVWRNGGLFLRSDGCKPNSEVSTTNGLLAAGTYVIDINDFRHADDQSPATYPERVCFDFTAN